MYACIYSNVEACAMSKNAWYTQPYWIEFNEPYNYDMFCDVTNSKQFPWQ